MLANVSDFAYMNVPHGNGDRAFRHSLSWARMEIPTKRSLSAHRQWHPAAYSAGKPVRDCRNDSAEGELVLRDAGTMEAVQRRSPAPACSIPAMEATILPPYWGA